MTISYTILLNDADTHIVTLRWIDGDNFRDEAFDLARVYPGASQMFAAMGLEMNYDATLTYLIRQVEATIANGLAIVAPPMWDASVPYQQIVPTTPLADRPQATDATAGSA